MIRKHLTTLFLFALCLAAALFLNMGTSYFEEQLRKTLTILSLIGLLLSVGLWGASYLNCAYCPNSARCLLLSHGAVSLEWLPPYDADYSAKTHIATAWSKSEPRVWIENADSPGTHRLMFIPGHWIGGFSGWRTYWLPHFGTTAAYASVSVPLWIPTITCCLLFMSCRPHHFLRRNRRKKLGLCLKCGYDVRASKERCPECGTEFEKRSIVGINEKGV